MVDKQLEIKVALLGYVGVGKTTILNALFGEKYSEMSRKRETAGVSFFRIVKPDTNKDSGSTETERSADTFTVPSNMATQKPASILNEIKGDNEKLRNSNMIVEKVFDIAPSDILIKMRPDTTLVIVDIPGINEADTDNIYKNYVEEKWNTFDCVVVVMDASEGVNTSEQVELLKFVKKNATGKRRTPVIIVGNKVDDADAEEQIELLQEVQKKVQEIFSIGNEEESKDNPPKVPSFIPISAIHAFFYRAAALLDYEDFKKLDKELIESVGKLENGKYNWKKKTQEEKYRAVFDVVSKSSDCLERLLATNFLSFIEELKLCVGDEDGQEQLLGSQLEFEFASLASGSCTAHRLNCIYNKCTVLGKDTERLKTSFWDLYGESELITIALFNSDLDVECLEEPVRLLEEYHAFVKPLLWKEEMTFILDKTKQLVVQQLDIIIDKRYHWDITNWESNFLLREVKVKFQCEKCPVRVVSEDISNKVKDEGQKIPDIRWTDLTPYDWGSLFESVLLAVTCKSFAENFGSRKVQLEHLAHEARYEWYSRKCRCVYCNGASSSACPSCSALLQLKGPRICCLKKCWIQKLVEGKLEPQDKNSASLLIQIQVPDSLADPKHFGHLIWKCCNLIAEVTTN